MNKLIPVLACWLLLLFSACASGDTQPTSSPSAVSAAQPSTAVQTEAPAGVDVDLTAMSATMVYSEVSHMVTAPDDYRGKTVRMTGTFLTSYNPELNVRYYGCVIQDATACCSQGLEFVLEGDPAYPDGYPKEGDTVTVVGVFDTYLENGQTFCHLMHSALE